MLVSFLWKQLPRERNCEAFPCGRMGTAEKSLHQLPLCSCRLAQPWAEGEECWPRLYPVKQKKTHQLSRKKVCGGCANTRMCSRCRTPHQRSLPAPAAPARRCRSRDRTGTGLRHRRAPPTMPLPAPGISAPAALRGQGCCWGP